MRQVERRTKVAMALASLALMLSLSGCSTVAYHAPASSASAMATPAKTKLVDLTAAALAANDGGKRLGGPITSNQAAALLAAAKGFSAYKLRTGQWVLTSLSKPLPANVSHDADAVASHELKKLIRGKASHARINAEQIAIRQIGSSALDSPHRQAVSLVHIWNGSSDPSSAAYVKAWIINGIDADGSRVASKAAGIAAYKRYLKRSNQSVPPDLVIADMDA